MGRSDPDTGNILVRQRSVLDGTVSTTGVNKQKQINSSAATAQHLSNRFPKAQHSQSYRCDSIMPQLSVQQPVLAVSRSALSKEELYSVRQSQTIPIHRTAEAIKTRSVTSITQSGSNGEKSLPVKTIGRTVHKAERKPMI